jgi:hypothetical protein
MNILNERVLINYDEKEKKSIEFLKISLFNQLNYLKNNDILKIFRNQRDIASEIVSSFKDRKIINIMVLSKTQSGKTGSMSATIEKFLENNEILTKNIYIISGLSSCSWKSQTIDRMPECLEKNIFHRDELLNVFVDRIKDKKNILIIIDEVQVASQNGQTIYKTFEKAGLLDKQKLYKNDIKILEFTATPDGTIYDLVKWEDASHKILANSGDGYVSSYDLLSHGRFLEGEKVLIGTKKTGKILDVNDDFTYNVEFLFHGNPKIMNFKKERLTLLDGSDLRNSYLETPIRVKQYKELCGFIKGNKCIRTDEMIFDNIREIKDDVGSFMGKKYHIIRTRNGENQNITIRNFKRIFSPNKDYNFKTFDENTKNNDINEILSKRPTKHTFIFIKEMLRCSKTLNKQYLGILYERYCENPDDMTIVQGLIGRDTGYDNNGETICYTNIQSIIKYEKIWNSGFENKKLKWTSKTTIYKNGSLSGKNTFNDPKNYKGFESMKDIESEDENEPIIVKFDTQDKAMKYFSKHLKDRLKELYKVEADGPREIIENDKGFFETKPRGIKKVFSCEEINKDIKAGLNKDKTNYRLRPCYRNVKDKSTVEWWLIHY